MQQMPYPQCAVCGKPVDRVDRYDNPMSMHTEFKVWCHGDMQIAQISHLDVMEGWTPVAAVAFVHGRIAP